MSPDVSTMPAAADRDVRAGVLATLGAGEREIAELLAYNENVFQSAGLDGMAFPLEDEPFVAVWEEYGKSGVPYLQTALPQLSFPIERGMSETENYRAATRKGLPVRGPGLPLAAPDACEIRIHATPAGRIPLLITPVREDFVALVRALTMRNEPEPVPASMGACMVAGFNNWDRVARYRARWEASNPGGDWQAEFQRMIPQKHLYQDRFIVLSDGPYSGVPAEAFGLGDAEWRTMSLVIRREHECAHYFTRRVFQSMRNNILDELIADYCGIAAAAGRYRAGWFLRFLGLEDFPRYREGGRLQNYRGSLSDAAFGVLQRLVEKAARNVEAFDSAGGPALRAPEVLPRLLIALSRFTLEELAAPDAPRALTGTLQETAGSL